MSAIQSRISTYFSIDTRILGVFRVLIGCIVLVDTISIIPYLDFFYSNTGVVPDTIDPVSNYPSVIYFVSDVLGINISWPVVIGVTIIVSTMYIIGHRAQLAAFILWGCLLLLHSRNPFLLGGGDVLLRYAVLFSIFMPINRRFSISQLRDSTESASHSVFTIGTIGLLSQVIIMYTVNLSFKLTGDMWHSGNALLQIYHIQTLATPISSTVTSYPSMLTFMTYIWVILLVFSPLLLSTTQFRPLLNTLFILGHTWILISTTSGIFPLITISVHLLFFRTQTLNIFYSKFSFLNTIYTSIVGNTLTKTIFTNGPTLPFSSHESLNEIREVYTFIFGSIFIFIMVLGVIQTVGVGIPSPAADIIDATETTQEWTMMAPNPPTSYGWYTPVGTFSNNTTINFRTGEQIAGQPTLPPNTRYPTTNHYIYYTTLRNSDNIALRYHYADYYCDMHTTTNTRLQSVTIYFHEYTPNITTGTRTNNTETFHTQYC